MKRCVRIELTIEELEAVVVGLGQLLFDGGRFGVETLHAKLLAALEKEEKAARGRAAR